MYDLHTHSRCSDGSESPEHVAELAKAAGIELLALTDHDCVRGVPAALSRAAQLGLRMLPGVEAEADYADTLHILGIGQDIDAPCFQKLLAEQTALREERNRLLEIKLRKMGMDVSDYLIRSESTTRANYAAALTAAGHAENTADAFRRILNSDALADIKQKHPSPQAVIDAVTGAGGAAILAHPMLMKKCDPHELVRDLADKGIWGIEAFYGAATEGEMRLFSSLSREFGLFATCGSDFHGKSRPNAPIGSGWRSCAQLEAALSELCRRFFLLLTLHPKEVLIGRQVQQSCRKKSFDQTVSHRLFVNVHHRNTSVVLVIVLRLTDITYHRKVRRYGRRRIP